MAANEALERLEEGNRRFVSDSLTPGAEVTQRRRSEVVEEQSPFAIILGCSDSRVPAEIVFDQGLGDLFVIRVAGNIVAPSLVGSVEFAAQKFGCRLVVVLGHSSCGAVGATLEDLRRPDEETSYNLRSIVDRIRPSLIELMESHGDVDDLTLLRKAIRANVERSVRQLIHGSEILEDLIRNKGLEVVGAEYSLETGLVEFFMKGELRDTGEFEIDFETD
ncbi:MAG: carbonic anhydrase [Thermoanaerobaculia bacterium]|nr:carbonic anhydrase [Thermoanaerobaculia bacterium]